ncbi:ABC transporter permease [Photobacterium alginatilyticum]|uniref:ABC transporter permease subunit n=1 Tax=Photobacterium alginatilyticum TaxID=1775171 RepID=A0ABW9YQZ6_9GAMM|nr:ABC transporter permease subunit [Photobacterium alginatilyticum]NBI56144.1 ABC transporter permease subunit [Photobacterium alginatilyticum]
MPLNPLTKKKLNRFRSIKRSYYSFVLLTTLVLLSCVAELLVNSRALVVSYQGELHFPTYSEVKTGEMFGLDYGYEVNYRQLKKSFAEEGKGNWVLMPVIPWNPYEQDFDGMHYPPNPPSLESQHYLGTDESGRDVLARLIYGFRIAIWFAMLTLTLCYTIGVLVGSLMGYLGGKFDLVMQRVIEVWSMVPFLYVIMIMVSIIQPSFFLFVLINVMFGWISITWYMRTMTYKEKAREYVMAARAQGAGLWRVIVKHILPNTMVMVITLAPFGIVANITTLTALDYLGLGLMPPTPSWGDLLQQGKSNLDAYWIIGSVVMAIVSVLTMVTFIGEGVREAFDPKKYTRYI